MSDWLFTTEQLQARQLVPQDIPNINALFTRSADYALLVDGEPPAPNAADGIFENRPPEVAAHNHYTIGLFDGPKLVGVIEALNDYPEAGTMYVGLMLLEPDYRGGGVGSAVHEAFKAWAERRGAARLMLSVVEENRAALRFWRRMGYEQTGTLPPIRFGQKTHVRAEMTLGLER